MRIHERNVITMQNCLILNLVVREFPGKLYKVNLYVLKLGKKKIHRTHRLSVISKSH
jgi:hypothetical protein